MKHIAIISLVTLAIMGCSESNQSVDNKAANQPSVTASQSSINYPQTKKVDVVDDYFGTKVADPYRWLEDDRSPETAEWVKQQNQVTFNYLKQIPYRETIKKTLAEKWNYEKEGAPFKEGDYYYFYKNNGLQNQYVVYQYKAGQKDQARVFLDPNKFSDDGTTSLATLSFSKDGKYAAYAISEGGSDWRKVKVIDVKTLQQLEPALENVKFSGISWLGNQGFFYSSYDKPEGSELSAKTDQHKLYYHQLGQPQAKDRIIFGATPEQKRRYVSATVTEDDHYLIISGAQSTSGNDLYLKDLTKDNSPLITIVNNFDSDTYLLDNQGDKLYFVTNLNAPNKRIVTVNASNPQPEHWQDLIKETDQVITPTTGGGYIFANYLVDAVSKVLQYNMQGQLIREIKLPEPGKASGFSGKATDTTLYFTFTNYKTPGTIYQLTPNTGEMSIYKQSNAQFNPDDYESKQVFYTSKDGTKVPMIITHRKGIELNGSNPTILYGYGGFNISLTPSFSVANAVWMDLGGVYAVANIRGGGEYGKAWHKAGTKLNKQNVFDDFIAAAEYLIEQKYTDSQHLAIRGGSNGGLLVGAVMTQRPDLMKVALPAVGVLDMLRYHTFTAGAGWAYDYGTAHDNKAMFDYLYAYSPVHNVKAGVKYPATLITTGDHDDRVVPAHSFKFAAELQAKQAGNNPVLIRIETNAGHGAGTPISKTIDLYADLFAFTLYNMGINNIPNK
jgi:prolyl oligopeptidase